MNYRHAFHAGNFADLVKHAALLQLLTEMQADPAPLTVIDTHAGRGVYDLNAAEARKSGEAQAGVARLFGSADPPAALASLRAAVERLNGSEALARYPGSPWLIAEALRPQDRYLACELRADEHAALRRTLAGRPGVETLCADGYALVAERTPRTGRVLVLIDPPFERADDYARAVQATAAVVARNGQARVLDWLPLKDLETFDAFLRDLQDAVRAPLLIAETRLRPLTDPLKMNGCALVLAGAPGALATALEPACAWVARHAGDGGEARVYRA